VENLSANKKLKRLSISCNIIDKIEDFPILPELLVLGLYGNEIASLDYLLEALPRCAPKLDTVRIEGNPVFHTLQVDTVRSRLAASLSCLQWVDNSFISRSENKTG
jgi:Leucine-rich repeat (LRR) protein